MIQLSIGRWKILGDVEATTAAFSQIDSGAPEICGCSDCRKFAESRHEAYPQQFLSFLHQLGVPFDRESEVYCLCQLENGHHQYCGWFHFVGEIKSGTDAFVRITRSSGKFDIESVTETFSLGITKRTGLVPDAFSDMQVVQIEFYTEIDLQNESSPVTT